MTNEEIIVLLNKDLEDEHGAIVQYLSHAYAIGEGEMSCEIEAIARDEMRHLDWLAEAIVDLGGTPSLNRGTMKMTGKTVPVWMGNDVKLEEDAIAAYTEHSKLIGNRKIKRLLKRILSDEKAHHGDFAHFVDKAKKEKMKDNRGSASDKVTKVLDWGIAHEYTVILQYLFHSYIAKDDHFQKEMQDQAINEMQHLGWLAEKMIDKGGSPIIEHTKVNVATKKPAMLKADIAIEKKVAAEYDRAAKEIKDVKVKKLLQRIRDNELYHVEVFNDLSKEK